MDSEVFFDMTRAMHPTSGSSQFMLKRWTRYSIYSKSGSFLRTENVRDNLYASGSVYLYDYVMVSDKFFADLVYTASTYDTTPAADSYYSYSSPYNPNVLATTNLWRHLVGTFKNSPNAITNNYLLTQSLEKSYTHSAQWPNGTGHPVYEFPAVLRDDGIYFEIVRGYPRNHFSHKRDFFSLYDMTVFGFSNGAVTQGTYFRNRQTPQSTIGANGLEDGSDPVQSTPVGDVNLIQTDNVINH